MLQYKQNLYIGLTKVCQFNGSQNATQFLGDLGASTEHARQGSYLTTSSMPTGWSPTRTASVPEYPLLQFEYERVITIQNNMNTSYAFL
jgi:hypothetical protein